MFGKLLHVPREFELSHDKIGGLGFFNSYPILADDIFIYIFVNEKFCMLITISLKFIPRVTIDNNPALV